MPAHLNAFAFSKNYGPSSPSCICWSLLPSNNYLYFITCLVFVVLCKRVNLIQYTFHAKMGTIKDRNGMNLTEAEDIKKKWQEYTELYKKDLHDWDNHNGMITHLKPDILECQIKWALGSITMNKDIGSDGIPVELFQILKNDFVKVLHSICQQIWKTQQWSQDRKRFSFQS